MAISSLDDWRTTGDHEGRKKILTVLSKKSLSRDEQVRNGWENSTKEGSYSRSFITEKENFNDYVKL